ncbi:MAG: hypothetical protein AB7F43_10250 [Bacteriovoracia bacterium]
MHTHLKDRSSYISGPFFDFFFILLAPLWGILISVLIVLAGADTFGATFIRVFTMGHLFIVLFRSHGNDNIRRLYPIRFFLIPALLLTGNFFSLTFYFICSVLAVWWDAYHSGLQTFGFGRIYDLRAKNNLEEGRRLDYVFNLFIYIGPILAGANLIDHLHEFTSFQATPFKFLSQVPFYAMGIRRYLTIIFAVSAVIFIPFYIFKNIELVRKGRVVSFQKVILFSITSIVCIWAWGFNPFGKAFFIMNFFHAFQYFAFVWWSEKGNISNKIRVKGTVLPAVLVVLVGFGYGIIIENQIAKSFGFATSFSVVISLLHFWYDGFIWSVQKKQIESNYNP